MLRLTALLTLLAAASTQAQGIINAAAAARQLTAQSDDSLSGTYNIRNVATGQYLQQGDSQSLYPGSSAADLQVYQHGRENWARISTPNMKCLSAQWGGDYDHAGVLYACAVGPNNFGGGLEKAKQWWLLIPASSGVKLSNAASRHPAAKPASRKPAARKPAKKSSKKSKSKAKPKPRKQASKSRKAASRRTSRRVSKHHHRRDLLPLLGNSHLPTLPLIVDSSAPAVELEHLTKRAAGGTYYIVATDHITDMAARALSSSRKKTGSHMSTTMELFKVGDRNQMWVFERS